MTIVAIMMIMQGSRLLSPALSWPLTACLLSGKRRDGKGKGREVIDRYVVSLGIPVIGLSGSAQVVRTEYAVREENRQAGVHQCQDPFCMRRYRSGARCKLNGVFYRAKV
ncbi:uncharacterized protein [Physcomitrium patens]|uniref:uncharacterized protein n=1 Tax=Physcomitrium patens TaxID=3218 RepID=UPI003CCC9D45